MYDAGGGVDNILVVGKFRVVVKENSDYNQDYQSNGGDSNNIQEYDQEQLWVVKDTTQEINVNVDNFTAKKYAAIKKKKFEEQMGYFKDIKVNKNLFLIRILDRGGRLCPPKMDILGKSTQRLSSIYKVGMRQKRI